MTPAMIARASTQPNAFASATVAVPSAKTNASPPVRTVHAIRTARHRTRRATRRSRA
jgi:hypothetical protein